MTLILNCSRRALWGQTGWGASQTANGKSSPSSSAAREIGLPARDSPRRATLCSLVFLLQENFLLVGSTLIVLIPQRLNDRAKMVAKLLHKITEVIRIISRRAWVLHRQGLSSSHFSTEARSLCSGCHKALRFMQSALPFYNRPINALGLSVHQVCDNCRSRYAGGNAAGAAGIGKLPSKPYQARPMIDFSDTEVRVRNSSICLTPAYACKDHLCDRDRRFQGTRK